MLNLPAPSPSASGDTRAWILRDHPSRPILESPGDRPRRALRGRCWTVAANRLRTGGLRRSLRAGEEPVERQRPGLFGYHVRAGWRPRPGRRRNHHTPRDLPAFRPKAGARRPECRGRSRADRQLARRRLRTSRRGRRHGADESPSWRGRSGDPPANSLAARSTAGACGSKDRTRGPARFWQRAGWRLGGSRRRRRDRADKRRIGLRRRGERRAAYGQGQPPAPHAIPSRPFGVARLQPFQPQKGGGPQGRGGGGKGPGNTGGGGKGLGGGGPQ